MGRTGQDAWSPGQASLGFPEPPLPWEGHARPSSIEDTSAVSESTKEMVKKNKSLAKVRESLVKTANKMKGIQEAMALAAVAC